MDSADKDLLIEIRLSLAEGGFEGSTGYPVQRDLILTAYHSLHPKDCEAEHAKIKLRWFHQTGDLRQFIEAPRSNIVWENQALDAALIRCPFPAGINRWGQLSRTRPAAGEKWFSEGFPLGADTESGHTDALPISGTLHAAASADSRFDLELPEAFRSAANAGCKSPQSWGGISGAPVFVRGQIVGLIVTTPKTIEGRLNAVFSAELFKAEGFEAAIGYRREDDQRVAALQAAAAACLKKSSACGFLNKALGSSADVEPDKLVANLLKLPTPEALIETFEQAHALACAEEDAQAAAKLRRLVEIALPACYYRHVVESIRGDVGNPGCPVLKPPRICNPPAAEVALAAVNGQPTAFRRVLISRKGESSKMAYVSDYKLDEPPKCGMKSEVEDVQFKLGWDNHLIGKFAPDINPNRFDMDRRMGVVSGRLQKEKRNHYVLIEAENTGNPDDLANWERRAKLLREDCPALVFMLLSNDNDWMVAETLLLDPFLKLLAEPKETDP